MNDAADFGARARRLRFVLVQPAHAGNIGAAARAIKAMGFTRLAVVAPREPAFQSDPQALAWATHARDVLQAATVHDTLPQALGDSTYAYAMTGYAREFGARFIVLREAAAETAARLARADETVAFVFGTERTGLTNEQVGHCQACCAIPAQPGADSLNLAQAVQLVAYELRLALAAPLPVSCFQSEPAAPLAAVEGMLAHLQQALVAIGYLDPQAPGRLMLRLRRLLARAQPTVSDIDILRGIAAAMIARKAERRGRKAGSN
ncbi:MAG: TrmH family RNA methyltransferase [Sutterellaceae bacterium]|nr:RNA methyltransferase [Burkholderiaceae bacterium]MCX7902133.1 RNA methyltransferase [Burkholderiaceae bacterium]MDW8430245.1 TrmH family RNA methyltransferase [Sutterellaceae bacterium]